MAITAELQTALLEVLGNSDNNAINSSS